MWSSLSLNPALASLPPVVEDSGPLLSSEGFPVSAGPQSWPQLLTDTTHAKGRPVDTGAAYELR